ncbi:hypothetical protein [Holdemanella biformis]
MNLSHTVKVVGSVVLSAVMAGSMMPVTVFAQNNDENPTEKTETVYSVLNSDGSISDTIVSSWLHDEDGINNIKETLNLTDVKNIKSNEKPSKDGNTYTWNAKGNDVYYEGTGTKQLPVSVKLRYELDGQEMSAKDMEGKSGHLKLTISFTNNYSEVKNINGKSIVIHPSYLAGGMLNMSTGNFTNVKCESGKIVNDGTNEMLAFANIPGLNETLRSAGLDKVNNQLGISDDVTVEADVNNFDLGSIMVGMTNEIDLASELGEIGSVSELTDGIDQLIEADDQLIDGSKQLYDGTTQLKEQAAPLTGSSDQVRQLSSGAIQLNDGVKALQTGLTAYTNGVDTLGANAKAMYGISAGVKNAYEGVSKVQEKKEQSLKDGAKSVSDGLDNLYNALYGQGVFTTTENLNNTLTNSITELDKMSEALGKGKDTLSAMSKSLEAANTSLAGLESTEKQLNQNLYEIVATEMENNQIVTNNNTTIKADQEAINAVKSSLKSSITTIKQAQADLSAEGKDEEAYKLDSYASDLNNELTAIDSINDLNTLTELTSTSDKVKELNSLISTLKNSLAPLDEQIKANEKTLDGLKKQVDDASAKLNEMQKTLETSTTDAEKMKTILDKFQPSMKKLKDGAIDVSDGVSSLDEGLEELNKQTAPGIVALNNGIDKLTSNNATLNGGASALSDATGTLAGQSGTFNEMADGLDTLGEAFETLNDGAKQLYEGNEQFKSEGLDQLKEKVDLGVGELETLQSVMNEIKAMNKEYASYSGAPEGATVTSRYVFRTKEESSK